MKCPLCLSKQFQFLFRSNETHGCHSSGSFTIPFYKCRSCACVYPKIKTNPSFYEKYYPKNYYQESSNFLTDIWAKFSFCFKNKLIGSPKTLLDVGCGQGDFVLQLNKHIKVSGIDIRPNSHPSLITGDFLTHKFSQKYDCITFWHSLEHFPHPRLVIKKAVSLLNQHGQILVTIPNTNSLAYKLGQQNWFHLDAPRHLFIPNPDNIKLLFPKNFQVTVTYSPYEFPLDLFWSFKKYPILRFFYPILKLFDSETMVVRAQN